MWQILKAEMQYSKLGMSIAYMTGLFCLVFAINWGLDGTINLAGIRFGFFVPHFGDIYSLMVSTSVAFFIAVVLLGVESDKEKRDHLYARLPLPIKSIGMARLMYMAIFQAGIFLMWLVLFLTESYDAPGKIFSSMLTANGALLAIILLFVIWHDLGYFGTPWYKVLFFLAIAIAVAGEVLWIVSLLENIGEQQSIHLFSFHQHPAGALVVNAIFVGLFYLSLLVFGKRRSYLQ